MFDKIAGKIAEVIGSAVVILITCLLIIGWFIGGFIFGFSDGYQLAFNEALSIAALLIALIIQNSVNRQNRIASLQQKELIRAVPQARNEVAEAEGMTEEQLAELENDSHR